VTVPEAAIARFRIHQARDMSEIRDLASITFQYGFQYWLECFALGIGLA
jgi:hypothetical protein